MKHVVIAVATLFTALTPQLLVAQKKNTIIFIGDGMGPQQLGLLYLANHYTQTGRPHTGSALQRTMNDSRIALIQPIPHQALVIDSACSATELAAGAGVLPEAVGIDASGASVKTVLEIAASHGKSTGLVSDTRITHATPAAFFAKVTHRYDENTIAQQLITSPVSVALSGGLRHFVPKATTAATAVPFPFTSYRQDTVNLLDAASQSGFKVVHSKATLAKVKGPRVLGLFAASGMEDAIQSKGQGSTQPTLEAMTHHALRLLEEDSDGLFLVVEAGQIDWAGHANDAGWLLAEMQRADRALGVILDWMKGRQDTFLLVTADHETGGFGFSYHLENVPSPKPFPGTLHRGASFKPRYNFVAPRVLSQLANQRETLRSLGQRWPKLPIGQQTTQRLVAEISKLTGVQISTESAQRILEQAPNPFFEETIEDLNVREWIDLCAYSAFHPNATNRFSAAVARELAPFLGVVWATGTHTSTPVIAAWQGDDSFMPTPAGMLSMSDLGRALVRYTSGEK
ncbi:MAG: alkaline phosphatase [Proteobacteria bacterium]|nr:alkaline phosphatase [Pseudomonadota bacterium]